MGRRRWPLLLALLAACLGAAREAGANVTSDGVRLVYDVYYLAFRILAVESKTFLAADGYRTQSHMQTVGALGFLFPWESTSFAFGAIEGPRLVPAAYQIRSTFRGRSRGLDLAYGAGGSVVDHRTGDFGDGERKPVPEEARVDTLDPLTAAVAISHALAREGTCTGRQRVFDGVRRYDLSYEDHGEAEIEEEGVAFGGRARLCSARVDPIGGFLESGPRSGEAPQRLAAWLAPVGGSAPVPVRLDLEGARGILHAYLQEAAPVAADGSAAR